jgi:hypothetical protein
MSGWWAMQGQENDDKGMKDFGVKDFADQM